MKYDPGLRRLRNAWTASAAVVVVAFGSLVADGARWVFLRSVREGSPSTEMRMRLAVADTWQVVFVILLAVAFTAAWITWCRWLKAAVANLAPLHGSTRTETRSSVGTPVRVWSALLPFAGFRLRVLITMLVAGSRAYALPDAGPKSDTVRDPSLRALPWLSDVFWGSLVVYVAGLWLWGWRSSEVTILRALVDLAVAGMALAVASVAGRIWSEQSRRALRMGLIGENVPRDDELAMLPSRSDVATLPYT
ncbi:MAG: hypothetical protein KatS3mg008_2204 [Acidimicrobiales bacterium]|nr:MAG: hypothetical protein KatS3mg008_2204 [Acidimicrobiales bacterium]